MPRVIQKMEFAVLIFSEGFGVIYFTYLSYSARDSGPLPLHNTGFDKKCTNLNQKQVQCIEGKVLQSKTVKT